MHNLIRARARTHSFPKENQPERVVCNMGPFLPDVCLHGPGSGPTGAPGWPKHPRLAVHPAAFVSTAPPSLGPCMRLPGQLFIRVLASYQLTSKVRL